MLVLGNSSTYSSHINHSGQDSLTKFVFSSSNISVRTWGSFEQKQQYKSGQYKMQTADCRLQIGYKMQTANWVQNTDWEFILFLAHSCWKQWVRYCSEADVDGSCISRTEVVFRGRKLYSVDGSCGPLSQNSKSQNEFRWSSETHVERNEICMV